MNLDATISAAQHESLEHLDVTGPTNELLSAIQRVYAFYVQWPSGNNHKFSSEEDARAHVAHSLRTRLEIADTNWEPTTELLKAMGIELVAHIEVDIA